MNYTITGSLGNISKPIVEGLVKAGHNVTVLTRNTETAEQINALGAKALIGSVEDSDFVHNAFAGADIVYTMIPPNYTTENFREYQNRAAKNMADSIQTNSVKKVVNLSSIGAHLGNGAGVVDGLADFESMLNNVENTDIVHLRPAFFYQNFYAQLDLIKNMGIMGGNYPGNIPMPFVHVRDIAAVALDFLSNPDFTGITVHYIVSDERTSDEVAQLLGKSIGKPELPWIQFPDDQQKAAMLATGMKETLVDGYQNLGRAFRDGLLQGDWAKNRTALSPTKLEDFISEFAPIVKATIA